MRITSTSIVILASCGILAGLSACEKQEQAATPPPAPATAQQAAPAHSGHHHSGVVVDLGTAMIGQFNVKATRDEAPIAAGGDSPIDVTVTPAADSTAKATAVRFWIGTQDAKGSVKAKAEIENPAEPDRWHTHAEVPDPLPADGKLWVEIEDDKGGTTVGSFDLKA